jgi:hypothetical protein
MARPRGDGGTEIPPEAVGDRRPFDDLLHRTCHLARALTGTEQAARKVDLDGDGTHGRKFFNLSERYVTLREYRVDPWGALLLSREAVAQTPGEPAGSLLSVGSEMAISSVAHRRSVARSSRTSALACTSASVPRLFRDGFVRQPPMKARAG